MASHRKNVMLAGRLRRIDQEVECTVRAVKVSLPGTAMYEYTNLMILDEPRNLPDGQYEVTYDGQTRKVQRTSGAWVSVL